MARINVFAAMDDPADVEYAERLVNRLADLPAQVELRDIDQLAAEASKGRLRHLAALGIPVFILSRSALADPARREFLAAGNPLLHDPNHRWYYLVRDVSSRSLLSRYPEIRKLSEEVMLVQLATDELSELIDDLREYLGSLKPPGLRQVLAFPVQVLGAVASQLLAASFNALLLVEVFGFLAGPVLLALLAFAGKSPLVLPLMSLCCFMVGTSVYLVEALDLWPRLGPAWKAGTERHGHEDSVCTDEMLTRVLADYRQSRGWAVIHLILWLALSAGPAIAGLSLGTDARRFRYAAVAVLLGLLVPLLRRYEGRRQTRARAAARGLTEGELARHQARARKLFVPPLPLPPTVAVPLKSPRTAAERETFEREQQTFERWFGLMAFGSSALSLRSWRPRPDYVFVSYVWRDDLDIRMADAVADSLSSRGIRHFVDKRRRFSRHAPWRSGVAAPLQEATHVILVISAQIGDARVIHSEMRTIIARWHVEASPAMICVVEPEVADSMSAEPDIEPYVRFFLACCPKLTFREARDPSLLGSLVAQRRRQGLLRDVSCLLAPAASEARMVATLVT